MIHSIYMLADSSYINNYMLSLYSPENFAHQLFKRMSNKNGRTYEAMILSLLKVLSVFLLNSGPTT
jgi:hypothetical protein